MTDTVLAFCPQPRGLKVWEPAERAAIEEWFALPEDLDQDFQADQCDNCGHNDYRAVQAGLHVDVVCKECGWEFVTAWLPERLAIF